MSRITIVPVALLVASLALPACTPSAKTTGDQTVYEENPINHEVNPADLEAVKSKTAIAANNVTLWVNGLGCPLCASNIDMQLVRVPGVKTVYVDLSVGKVTIGLDPAKPHPSPARLNDAVLDAGFTLVKIENQ